MKLNDKTLICSTDQLKSGSTGFKFFVVFESAEAPAFVVRFKGVVYGYLNRCAHLMLELDWDDAEFYDASGDYLICSNHGAMFEPDTGVCINGPCYGASLASISVVETNSNIYLDDDRFEIRREGV